LKEKEAGMKATLKDDDGNEMEITGTLENPYYRMRVGGEIVYRGRNREEGVKKVEEALEAKSKKEGK
jgi:hypothetical protein